MEARKGLFGPEHSDMLRSIANFSNLHSAQGKHNETAELALHVLESSHTSQHPSLIAAELAPNALGMQCDATDLQEPVNNKQSLPGTSELLFTASLPISHPPNLQAQVSLPISSSEVGVTKKTPDTEDFDTAGSSWVAQLRLLFSCLCP